MYRRLVVVLALVVTALPAAAQTLVLTGTSPADGAVGVAAQQAVPVRFTVDRAVEPSSLLGLIEAPEGVAIADTSFGDGGRSVTFQVVHDPDRDYLWTVDGFARDQQGRLVFVPRGSLRYTTAASFQPAATVSGSVVLPGGTAPDFALLLVELYAVDGGTFTLPGSLVATATLGTSTTFGLANIRPGRYRIRAIGFTQAAIDQLRTVGGNPPFSEVYAGQYDADGDDVADLVDVDATGAPAIELDLAQLSALATTAAASDLQARERAQTYLLNETGVDGEDLQLTHIDGSVVLPDGTGFWTYTFFSAEAQRVVAVDLNPLVGFSIDDVNVSGQLAPQVLPEAIVDTDAVFDRLADDPQVESFLSLVTDPLILVRGGRPPRPLRPDTEGQLYPNRHVWEVRYLDFTNAGLATLIAYADMQTGEVLGVFSLPALGSATASVYEGYATGVAEAIAGDEEAFDLIAIRAEAAGFNAVSPTRGTGQSWTFIYRLEGVTTTDTQQDDLLYVIFDQSFGVQLVRTTGEVQPIVVIPDDYVDSDTAVEIMEDNGGAAFRAAYARAYLMLLVGGGSERLAELNPGAANRPAWMGRYTHFSQAPDDELILWVDMQTGEVLARDGNTTIPVEQPPDLPARVRLEPNYPNPFATATQITFELAEPQAVQLVVYDLLGRAVATLADGRLPAGRHTVTWAPSELADGVYVSRLDAGGVVTYGRMMLRR